MTHQEALVKEIQFKNSYIASGRVFNGEYTHHADVDLDIISIRPDDGFDGYYVHEATNKTQIVLHHTAGHLMSDINVLTSESRGRVSVSYVIGRCGDVYELFPDKYWSWHLGRSAIGGNTSGSKKSIGIEISNYGYLTPDGDDMLTGYSTSTRRDVYCKKSETHLYKKLDQSFKGKQYYDRFTEHQYVAIKKLVKHLSIKHDIPLEFLDEWNRYEANIDAASHEGIISHVNVRKDKYDLSPVFEWDRIADKE